MEISLPDLVKRTPPPVQEESKEESKEERAEETREEKQRTERDEKAREAEKNVTTEQKPSTLPHPKRTSIFSLGALLAEDKPQEGVVSSSQPNDDLPTPKEVIDPKSQPKLEGARSAIMDYLSGWRPRFIAVFETMTIEENRIKVVVPTQDLREEILRNKTELLTRVVTLSGVDGVVELNIDVNEEVKGLKPIKLEDRIAYFMELNPAILDLKEALDLDVEG